MNSFRISFLISALLLGSWLTSPSFGDETLAYQLAVLQTRAQNPENDILKRTIPPQQSEINEFQWILDSLQNRCVEPEQAIANTMIDTWHTLRNNKFSLSLLDVARELLRNARDTRKFGMDKVHFYLTSQYWLSQKLIAKKTQNLISNSSHP